MSRPIYEPSPQRTDARLGYTSAQLQRRPGPVPGGAFVGIIFQSTTLVVGGDDAGNWFLAIPRDLDGAPLTHVAAVVYTAGSAEIAIQIRNVTQATDLLSTLLTIDSGENSSYTAAVPAVITPGIPMAAGDVVVVDVDDPGADAEGLDIILGFSR